MTDFRGIRAKQQRRYDYLMTDTEQGAVLVGIAEGEFRNRAGLALDPKTARKLAADLIRLADEAELKSQSAEGTSPVASPR